MFTCTELNLIVRTDVEKPRISAGVSSLVYTRHFDKKCFSGGRVRHHLPFWKTICKDKYVLDIIDGVSVQFDTQLPTQLTLPRELKMNSTEQEFVDEEISHLLQEGFIVKLNSHIPSGWVSNVFLVPKRQGGFRMILNLKDLNQYVKYTKFKMDGIEKVVHMMREGDFFASLDLRSAFGHLYIKKEFQKYFQFTWRGQFYCYVTLQQGFADSPHLFVRCMSPLMAILREVWIDILIYIDDTFLRAPTSQQLLWNLKYTQMLFEKCGLSINLEKSCLSPTTRMEFLGFVLDSIDFTISITAHKRRSLRHLIEPIVTHPLQKIHIKKLAKIIGIIVSFFPASDEAKLHYRILERYKTRQVSAHKSWKFHLRLDRQCIAELNWWYERLERDMTKSLRKRDPTVTIFTDSSKIGFGSVWNGEELQGQFTEKQKTLSINTKELLAIYYTIKYICKPPAWPGCSFEV